MSFFPFFRFFVNYLRSSVRGGAEVGRPPVGEARDGHHQLAERRQPAAAVPEVLAHVGTRPGEGTLRARLPRRPGEPLRGRHELVEARIDDVSLVDEQQRLFDVRSDGGGVVDGRRREAGRIKRATSRKAHGRIWSSWGTKALSTRQGRETHDVNAEHAHHPLLLCEQLHLRIVFFISLR